MAAFPSALPPPRTPDPMDAPPLRWGVLGTGWIAERFASALQASTRQVVAAVGSRSSGSAQRFAGMVGAERAHASYDALVADPGVDVVYVATPHNLHAAHARLAIEAGKPCLVEKPMGINAAEARALSELAATRGVFLMEAMWTLCLPKYDVVRQLLEDGVLGEVRSVVADLGEWFDPGHRILDPALAGGPMLDLGTYPFTLATWVLGRPDEVVALGAPGPRQAGASVDGQLSAALRYGDRATASLHATVLADTPTTASVSGDLATVRFDRFFYRPGGFTLVGRDGDELRWDEPPVDHAALYYEACEVARQVTAGETSSPLRPLADTVTTLEAMDAARRSLGVTFVGESSPGVPLH